MYLNLVRSEVLLGKLLEICPKEIGSEPHIVGIQVIKRSSKNFMIWLRRGGSVASS